MKRVTEGFAKDVIIKALSARCFKANAMPAASRRRSTKSTSRIDPAAFQ